MFVTKEQPKKYLVLIYLFGLFFIGNKLHAQCGYGWNDSGITPVNPTAASQFTPSIKAGQYFLMNVVNGGDYTLSTCGLASWDTQISVYNESTAAFISYNDDFCGTSSETTFMATFTGQVRVIVTRFDCSAHNGRSTQVEYYGGISQPELLVNDVLVDEDAGTANFIVTHSGGNTSSSFTVDYAIAAGTATEGVDYTTSSGLYTGTLNFNGTAGDTDLINVLITDDFDVETDETYTIQFTSATDSSVNITDTATGTINNDDIPAAIQVNNVAVDEDAGSTLFTVTHTGVNRPSSYTVDYLITAGTATEGIDYTTSSGLYTGTLNFNGTAGDTDLINVLITDDFDFEPSETYTISFTSVTDASVNITDTATGTINDNENDPNNTRPYEERYAMNIAGNFIMRGNTNLECVSNCPGTPTTNNPSVVMGYSNIDGDSSTTNSSSSTITIPVGATVEYAALYWGGMYNSARTGITNPPGTLSIDQVKLKEPGASSYSAITAQVRNIETSAFSDWDSFMSYADITSVVQAGGSGDYFVADIALAIGSSFTGSYGGWTMVIVYSDPTEKTRNISVWDGFDFFGFGANEAFTVTGLLTPSSGVFESHIGYFGFDGEASSSGDFVTINGSAIANTLNPNDNILNGTISEYGSDVGSRNPNFGYSWGIDIDVFDATGLVPNSATDMDVVLGSSSEGIWGGVFVTSNEIAFPTVATSSFDLATITLGEESTLTITIDNPSNGVSLTNLALTNNLPLGMTIAATPDAASTCGGTISAVTGTSNFSISGVSLPAGSSCTFTFDVTTSSDGTFTNTISPLDITNDQNIPLSGSTTSDLIVLPLPDNDNDTIPDIIDLDDDNDGILDTQETLFSILWVTDGTAGVEEQNTIDKLTALGYSVTVVDDSVGGDANNYGVTFIYEDANSGTAFANVDNMATTINGVITSETFLHDEILGASQGATTITSIVEITNNTHPITNGLSIGDYDIGNASYRANNLNVGTGTVLGLHPNGEISIAVWESGETMPSGPAPGRRAIVPHSNDGGIFNSAGEDLLVNAILWTSRVDTDLDGVDDYLDLDSDNDGIYDAVEANHNQSHTNGVVNGSVGSDGVPNAVQASGQEDSGIINYTVLDSDTDGNLDAIEIDSDDDGCNDVVEAGFTESGTTAGELQGTGYNLITGLVTGSTDGYTIPADVDTNLVFDYRELGLAPSITTEPINTIICPGCNGTFEVIASNTDIYQWQQFNGTTWVNITDTGIYSGTATNILSITNPTVSENGNQYRVITTSNTYACMQDDISNTVVLTIRVASVITNRRITYRVKKN